MRGGAHSLDQPTPNITSHYSTHPSSNESVSTSTTATLLITNTYGPVSTAGPSSSSNASSIQNASHTSISTSSMLVPGIGSNLELENLTNLLQDIEMTQIERLFWIFLFSLMVLVAAGGNMIVIYIVSTNREMKSVTNYFLVNLSLADTMVSTLNVIFNFISMLNR